MEKAFSLIEYFKKHTQKVFGVLTEDDKKVNRVLKWVQRQTKPALSNRDLQQAKIPQIESAADARYMLSIIPDYGINAVWLEEKSRLLLFK